jgi:cyclopropane fatty-acyl-phospholipid synthase-like methyltransferase
VTLKTGDRLIQAWRMRRAIRWIPWHAKVLDVGCADGELFRRAGDRVASGVGVDIEPPNGWVAGDHVERRHGDFPDVVCASERFDAVVMLAVIEHVADGELQRWARVAVDALAPGGRVIATVPSPKVDRLVHYGQRLRVLDGMAMHQHHGFDPGQVPAMFTGAGLRLEATRRFQFGLNNLFVLRKPD